MDLNFRLDYIKLYRTHFNSSMNFIKFYRNNGKPVSLLQKPYLDFLNSLPVFQLH